MIKRIIILVVTIICCALLILICIFVRNFLKRSAIKAEMEERMDIIVEEDNLISIVEFSPFIWDKVHAYGTAYNKEHVEFIEKDLGLKYMTMPEYRHRMIFVDDEVVVFDTRIVCNWYFGMDIEVFTKDHFFVINASDEFLNYKNNLHFKIKED